MDPGKASGRGLNRATGVPAILSFIRICIREPLLHFVALAMLVFALWYAVGGNAVRHDNRIVISAGQLEQAIAVFAATHMRAPSGDEMQSLIDDQIRVQVYCREAVALGLDRDDPIIQRRLEQKFRFVSEDTAQVASPSEAELQEFLARHQDAFEAPATISFSQIFINPQLHENVDGFVQVLIDRLNKERGRIDYAGFSDVLPVPNDYEAETRPEIARIYGAEFCEALLVIPAGQWTGPIRSGFGTHLVFVRECVRARPRSLSEVREHVLREWRNAHRVAANAEAFRQLRAKYDIAVEMPAAPKEPGVAHQVTAAAK